MYFTDKDIEIIHHQSQICMGNISSTACFYHFLCRNINSVTSCVCIIELVEYFFHFGEVNVIEKNNETITTHQCKLPFAKKIFPDPTAAGFTSIFQSCLQQPIFFQPMSMQKIL